MNIKKANENLIAIIQQHLIFIQSGKFGKPSIEDLNFCGKLHTIIEQSNY